jgi:hypothetical protein
MELLALLILLGILAFYVTLPSKEEHAERPAWPWKLIPYSEWDPHTAPSNARITEPLVKSSVRPWGSHGRTAQGVHHF